VDGEAGCSLNTQRLEEGFYLALPADAALKARIDALSRGESTTAASRHRRGADHVAGICGELSFGDRDGILVLALRGQPAEAAAFAKVT